MLQMNLIRQKELYGEVYGELWRELWRELGWEVYWEVWREFYREVYGKLRREVNWPLGSQIHTDFSQFKISRV